MGYGKRGARSVPDLTYGSLWVSKLVIVTITSLVKVDTCLMNIFRFGTAFPMPKKKN